METGVKSPTVAIINMKHLHANIASLRKHANCNLFMAVVKTNAYGHGIVPIAKEALKAGADRLGVSTAEEGILLRQSGVTAPIHILGGVLAEQAELIVSYELITSVSSLFLAKKIHHEALKQKKTAVVHVKIDTGLHRFGINPADAPTFCGHLFRLSNIHPEGIYTHFASADEGNWQAVGNQYELFKHTVSKLYNHGFSFAIHHVGASTIAMEIPDMHLDMIRPGIALTGYHPEQRQKDLIHLKPLLTLKSTVVQVNEVPAGTAVGYGGEFVTRRESKIAVVAVGHGDGYSRALSNNGQMLIHGKRVAIVGTISLDQTMVDVTDIAKVETGDEAVLIGKQGQEIITAREVANWMGSIVDEVLANLSERIPRRYI